MMRSTILAACILAPTMAFAVGAGSDSPPKETKTTGVCADGLIYDENTKACVEPKESRLDDDRLYQAVRELAWAGRYGTALETLDQMSNQADDRVLTYRGFVHRKMGDRPRGMAYYQEAIATNPNNLLARSYMGQAHAEVGEFDLARVQLREIRARGGRMTWPEVALKQAIESGRTTAY